MKNSILEFDIDSLNELGIITYISGDKFEGQIKINNAIISRENFGIYSFSNGSEYKGTFVNNLFEGFGVFHYRNGEIYEGNFKNGLKHGFGRYIYSNNSEFLGYFEEDLQNGIGLIKNSLNSSNFFGKWSKGLKEGKCIYYKEKAVFVLIYSKNQLKSIEESRKTF